MGKMKELDIAEKNAEIGNYAAFTDYYWAKSIIPKPVKVMYDFPYTIVEFADGEKTCVRCHNEAYDYEKGLAMAIAKRVMTRADFDRLVESGKTFFESKMERIRKGKRNIEEKIL
jgi:hypothetical protein